MYLILSFLLNFRKAKIPEMFNKYIAEEAFYGANAGCATQGSIIQVFDHPEHLLRLFFLPYIY